MGCMLCTSCIGSCLGSALRPCVDTARIACFSKVTFARPRTVYAVMFLLYIIIVEMTATFWIDDAWNALDNEDDDHVCNGNFNNNTSICRHDIFVKRSMFGVVAFHMLFATLSVFFGGKSEFVERGIWFPKAVIFALLVVVGMSNIPARGIFVMDYISYGLALIFIVFIQASAVVDGAGRLNETLAPEEDDYDAKYINNKSISAYVCLAGFVSGIAAFSIAVYVAYAHGSGCKAVTAINTTIVTANVVAAVVVSVLSVSPKIQERRQTAIGILHSTALSLYATYILFVAVETEPAPWFVDCGKPKYGWIFSLSIGAIFLATVAFVGTRPKYAPRSSDIGFVRKKGDDDFDVDKKGADGPKANFSFHFESIAMAAYASFLLCSWRWGNGREGRTTSFVTKVTTVPLIYSLYVWTLVAPLIFPDRNFE